MSVSLYFICMHGYMYVRIYIYIYMYLCVCVWFMLKKDLKIHVSYLLSKPLVRNLSPSLPTLPPIIQNSALSFHYALTKH